MKTILYQPIFINPQAYFVFPSLYHIEKGDSFIEPANITGQLIINTLTDDPTLTPIILTVKDNNQVDFSIFAGKHIRISQYTDEGAVVLGEWYIPGTPEPEYPDWFKDSVIALYDPAKQGMTNYDVIEAYVEDFTTWHYLSSRGTATVTTNKIIITKSFSNIQNIIEDNKSPYDDIKIYVTGISKDNPLTVNQYVDNKWVRLHTYTTDGIYIIKNRNLWVGFGTYITDNCNITITQLPTSILQDLSGNGNHAYLYGGKGKLNSGMGVYQQDFSKLIISRVDKKQDPFSFTVSGSGGSYLAYMQLGNWNNKAFKILVNINAERDYLHLRFRNNTDAVITSVALKNGENIIPAQNIEGATKAVFEYSLKEGETITITQIPDYPDQLCYDGKMYAVCYGFPILTDYTVMAERTWFDNEGNRVFITKGNIWPNCAFNFEKVNVSLSSETFSYSQSTNIDDLIGKSGITYQTKQSYNGKVIGVGTSSDGDILLIGGQLKGEYIGCHGKIIISDRSFTEDEITWLKENIYNIEI